MCIRGSSQEWNSGSYKEVTTIRSREAVCECLKCTRGSYKGGGKAEKGVSGQHRLESKPLLGGRAS